MKMEYANSAIEQRFRHFGLRFFNTYLILETGLIVKHHAVYFVSSFLYIHTMHFLFPFLNIYL